MPLVSETYKEAYSPIAPGSSCPVKLLLKKLAPRSHALLFCFKMVPNENIHVSLISPLITVIFSVWTSCKVPPVMYV